MTRSFRNMLMMLAHAANMSATVSVAAAQTTSAKPHQFTLKPTNLRKSQWGHEQRYKRK